MGGRGWRCAIPTISTLTVDVQTRTSKFSTGLKVLTGGLTALAAGAAFAFHEFEESNKITEQTGAVLKSTGGAANVTAKQVESLASALSEKTAVDDEVVASGENVLLTFTAIRNEVGKGNDIFDRATRLTLDLSVAMGQDMKSSAIQVGKALNDPIAGLTSLSRIGVRFSEETKETIARMVEQGNVLGAQKLILHELSTEFKGSAEAQKTASAAMGVALGNLAETIGGLLAPAITVLADGLSSVVGFLQENAAPAFKVLVTWLGNVWDAIKPVAEALGRDLLEAATQTWHVIQVNLVPALMRFWEAVKPVVIAIGAAVIIILKLALEALPVVINAISLVIDWLALQVKAFRAVVEFVKDHFVEPIVGAIQRIIEWIIRVADRVRDTFGGAWQAILGPIKAVIDRVIGWIQDIIDAVQTAIEWLSKLNPISESRGVSQETGLGQFRPPPGLQQGGFVARTGLAVVHAGETVIPRDGRGIVVNFYGPVMGADVGRVVRDELLKLGKRNAGTGL